MFYCSYHDFIFNGTLLIYFVFFAVVNENKFKTPHKQNGKLNILLVKWWSACDAQTVLNCSVCLRTGLHFSYLVLVLKHYSEQRFKENCKHLLWFWPSYICWSFSLCSITSSFSFARVTLHSISYKNFLQNYSLLLHAALNYYTFCASLWDRCQPSMMRNSRS